MGPSTSELKQQLATEREAIARDLEAVGDRVSPGRIAQRRTTAVKQRFGSMKERVMGVAEDAGGSVRGTASTVTSSVTSSMAEAPERARRTAQGNPLAVGLVAFGVGAVLAAVIPESEREQQMAAKVQPQLEQVASTAGEAAQHVAEQVKPVVQDAAQDVKQHTQEAASAVKETAQRAASTGAQQAKETVQSARPPGSQLPG